MLDLLIVEDDRDVSANIAEYLEPRGYRLDFAYDGKQGVALALQQAFDVIVLDLGLPRLDGVAVGAALRDANCVVPLLVLTARDALDDKAAAFDVGVDDYLVKPFAMAELEMRIRALARRAANQGLQRCLRVGDLELDLGRREARRGDTRLYLNRSQFVLLSALMRDAPNVVTRQSLQQTLWGDDLPGPDALRTHVFELRQVVDRPFDAQLIHTVHGQGYAVRAPE